jgi:small-conductance mechanosensitive channel
MQSVFLGNPVSDWILAVVVLVLVFSTLILLHKFVVKKLKVLSERTATLVDDLGYELLSITHRYFFVFLSIYTSSYLLNFTPDVRLFLYRAFIFACLLQGSEWGRKTISFWIENYLKKRALSDAAAATSIGLVSFSVTFAMYIILILLAIHNLGFNITTLIAGLGVGGIAVALAVQNILSDLFASLSIVLDKPFVVGDFIVVEDFKGAIEHIGLKTTRIRSLSGEQLIFSNSDLLKSRVRNFKRMTERRVCFKLGVVYQTSVEKLSGIPVLIKEIVAPLSGVRLERVHFLTFGASSLDFEIVYWVETPDFNSYADIAQTINLEIFRRFSSAEIDFAYPTQTLFVQNGSVKKEENDPNGLR